MKRLDPRLLLERARALETLRLAVHEPATATRAAARVPMPLDRWRDDDAPSAVEAPASAGVTH